MSTLSTHVLDTSLGRPAAGVPVLLEHQGIVIASGATDTDGRVPDFKGSRPALLEGIYTLRFDVSDYFTSTGRECFYPCVTISFRLGASPEHYHVPLLISPFGYSTYRGS
ncbi:MAG: hydroxyisourate hydrolase [Gemmatimonadota bacterium]|nr:hydroxyisourate hydrolase [Gemmatimonadota bacterium]